ncbi:uncharacterized protein LOC110629259 [Manihot esculenta]|uniref:Uncharacterized protein n=1 Tax=Manihot esculenta TaxID=3983 RepID=A0A2C9UQM9_MANES|nr:uncharacterized protein LOC110629259 [Manihot esculenta]OAY33444.1 hypothetical protein MANES_13G096700v8 [Manihot esculenta]
MGFSEAEKSCKDHPSHNKKQGVCPSCLRERLSQLHMVVSREKESVADMAAGPYSSSNSISSAHHHHHRHRPLRNMSEKGLITFRVSAGNGLKKSRSVAFVSRNSVAGEVKHGSSEKINKKKGFWSKLLDLKGGKMAV